MSPGTQKPQTQNMSQLLLNKKLWMFYFLFVSGISILGLFYLGGETYHSAPPLENFVSDNSQVVTTKKEIYEGQKVFLRRGLMNYGSFWGDGAERGPDFTADALHFMTQSMASYYKQQEHLISEGLSVSEQVKQDLHSNGWDEKKQTIHINSAQAHAFTLLSQHYNDMFNNAEYSHFVRLGHQLSKEDIQNLTSFFFWGAWATAANRPGQNYSYTHNWPYDPDAGNFPTPVVYIWSILSILILFFGIGIVLYAYGQMKSLYPDPFDNEPSKGQQWLTTDDLEQDHVRPTQRSTYKFFAFAMILFGFQILAGIIAATDFVRPFGIYLGDIIPFSVARSYHILIQIFWFFMCWVGYTIFFLPGFSKVPKRQRLLINILFGLCVFAGVGSVIGIYLGQKGLLTGEMAYWLGSQGWEFMEFGRLFQMAVLVAFSLWIYIIFRSVRPWLTKKRLWSPPAWLLYGSGVMVFFLFFGLLVTPETNFAVADFWRWMVVHMWVEVTFEVFTTVVVAYIMVQMKFINKAMAERAIFLAVMLFLFTATIGVAHNFYWIGKTTEIIALGSVFSTLQVLPLLLLTLDAWQMRKKGARADELVANKTQRFAMNEVWLFILAVNFWNVFGAGMFGSLINLPIVNYFEHATYLTNNHAHGAMFGVKGNVALAGMLYCCQHLFPSDKWNAKLIRTSFWSLNVGIAMMMFLDLFPVGVYQLAVAIEEGFWFARSREIVEGPVFKTLTYFRSVGGTVFVFGGLLPMIWFVLSRGRHLLPEGKPQVLNTDRSAS